MARRSKAAQDDKHEKFTTPQDFYQGLIERGVPTFLQCRGYGHSWSPHTVITHGSKRNPSYEVTVICSSCSALRTDFLDRFGETVRDSITSYSHGYVAPGSGGAMRGTRGVAKLVGVTKTGRFTKIVQEDN